MTAVARVVALPSDKWATIHARAPRLAATMSAYLDQIALTLRPASVEATELALRDFAGYLVDHTRVGAVRGLRRGHLEGYRSWLSRRELANGKTISPRTVRHRLGFLRNFFERLIEWEWDDAPRSGLIVSADLPIVDEPLPRFLDDTAAAALIRAAATAKPLDRLLVEVLARTGMRVGELCTLAADAVVHIGDSDWLRVPVGKLHNDRYVPLHPVVAEVIAAWRAEHPDDRYLITRDGAPLKRHYVNRRLIASPRPPGSATSIPTSCATRLPPSRSTGA